MKLENRSIDKMPSCLRQALLCAVVTAAFLTCTSMAQQKEKEKAAAPQEKIFAAKPAWWDATAFKPLDEKTTDPNAYYNNLLKQNAVNWQRITDWKILGPFQNQQQKVFTASEGIEINPDVKTFKWWDGRAFQWQALTDQSLPTNLQNFAYIGYATMDATEDRSMFFKVQATGSVRIWVNGSEIDNTPSRPGNAYVQIQFKKGRNDIIVKQLHSSGPWNLDLSWSAFNPYYPEIKSRSFSYIKSTGNEDFARQTAIQIGILYIQINDPENFKFWINKMLAISAIKKPETMAYAINQWRYYAHDNQMLLDLLAATLLSYAQQITDPKAAAAIANEAVQAALDAGDPEAAEKILTITKAPPNPDQAVRALYLYRDVQTTNSLNFWLSTLFTDPGRKHVNSSLGIFRRIAESRDKDKMAIVLSNIEKYFDAMSTPNMKNEIAQFYMDQTLNNGDITRARNFLPIVSAGLGSKSTLAVSIWRLKVALIDVDEPTARTSLDIIKKLGDAKFLASREMNSLEYAVAKMNTTLAAPNSIDSSFDTTVNSIARLSQDDENFFTSVRDTLMDKSKYVEQDEQDKNLYRGMKNKYRTAFSSYNENYQDMLDDYLTKIKGASPESKALAETMKISAAIALPETRSEQQASTLSVTNLPATVFRGMNPVADMPYGFYEMKKANSHPDSFIFQTPFCAVEDKENIIVQNSKGITCFSSNKVIWSRLQPLFGDDMTNLNAICNSDTFVPAISGNIVAGKYLSGRKSIIYGIKKSTGKILWTRDFSPELITSGIAAWESSFVFLISKPSDTIQSISLIVVDAATGQTRTQLSIANGNESFYLANDRQPITVKGILPAPTVSDNHAYFETGIGAIGAVNLPDQSLLWIRVYPQVRVDEDNFSSRHAKSPVVGKENVLFAPIDSPWIFLINKTNGTFVSRRTDITCTSLGKAGENTAVITTPSSISFLSLISLNSLGQTIIPNALFTKTLSDGCVISAQGRMIGYDDKGKEVKVVAIPKNTAPIAYTGTNIFLCGGSEQTTIGTASGISSNRPCPRLAAKESFNKIVAPECIPAGSGTLIIEPYRITYFDDKNKPLWSRPIPDMQSVSLKDETILLTSGGTTRSIDAKTGTVSGYRPNSTDGKDLFFNKAVYGNAGIYAIRESGRQSCDVYKIATDAPNKKAEYIGNITCDIDQFDKWTVIETDTEYMLAVDGYRIRTAVYKRSKSDTTMKFDPMSDINGTLWINTESSMAKVFSLTAGKSWAISSEGVKSKELSMTNKNPQNAIEIHGDIIILKNQTTIMFIDAVTDNSFSSILSEIKAWGVAGTSVYWLSGKSFTLIPYSINLRNTMKPTRGEEVEFHTSELRSAGIGAFGDDACALLIKAPDSSWAVIWEGNEKPYISLMPFGGEHNIAYTLNNRFSYFCNSLLTTSDLKECLNLNDKVSEVRDIGATNMPDKIIDGFLDECSDEDLVKTDKCRYTIKNLVASKDQPVLYIGIEITDPAIIRRIATDGLEDRTEFSFLRGRDAIFRTDKFLSPIILNTSTNNRLCTFAYSITPDAKKCQIEIKATFPNASQYRPYKKKTDFSKRHNRLDKDSANSADTIKEFFGEFAIRFIWTSDFGTQENLLESETEGPLSFTRFIFTD